MPFSNHRVWYESKVLPLNLLGYALQKTPAGSLIARRMHGVPPQVSTTKGEFVERNSPRAFPSTRKMGSFSSVFLSVTPSLPNTLRVDVWTHKHLLTRPLGAQTPILTRYSEDFGRLGYWSIYRLKQSFRRVFSVDLMTPTVCYHWCILRNHYIHH